MASTRGVTKNADLDPSLISRDTRSWRRKLQGFAADSGAGVVVGVLGILTIILPFVGITALSDPIVIFAFLFWIYARNKVRSVQFRTRMELVKGKKVGDGIFFLGNDLTTNSEIWFSNDDFRTHMLVFGSTGSGKTRFLLGLLYQALLVGSGCMYVDGKGDNTVWWLVFSFCRRVDRGDDLLVMNYLTGGDTKKSKKDGKLLSLSNTNNPFAHGSGEQLRSLVVGLMRESGGDGDMWKGMASAMMGGLLKCLTHMRDSGEMIFDVATLRDYLPLDQIVRLSLRPDLPDSALAPIKKYLGELPGYVEEEAILGRINPKVYEQHGYRIMQFSEVLSDLEDTYGHIFSAPLGEVDFKDVVFNRRILFVMLPALEKDPDALAGLGKMVVAGVRSALAPALGNKLEGLKSEVIDQKPTTSNVPFLMILDEYGYYSVKGFAVVAAQARSLGVSVVFAGQDYPSFKKGSEEEAQATIANTNVKVGMKVEEEETAKIIIGRGGKGKVTVSEGSEMTFNGVSSGYKDSDRVRIEEKERIDLRDLVNQKPGQAHVMFGDELTRCQLFYAEPHQVYEGYLNKFVMIEPAKKSKIDTINGVFDRFNKLFIDSISEGSVQDTKSVMATDDGIKKLFSDLSFCKKHNESSTSSSIMALGLVELRSQMKDVELKAKAVEATAPVVVKPAIKVEQIEEKVQNSNVNSGENQGAVSSGQVTDWDDLMEISKVDEVPEDLSEILVPVDDLNRPESSVVEEASIHSLEFEELLNKTVLDEAEKNSSSPISPKDKVGYRPRNTLTDIERGIGATVDEAKKESGRAMEILGERTRYPKKPTPSKSDRSDMDSTLSSLLSRMQMTEI
jgi:intracellular multiplication protein IcmO